MYVIVENTGDIGQLRRKYFSRTTHRVPENKILFKKSKSGLITLVIIKQKTGEHV